MGSEVEALTLELKHVENAAHDDEKPNLFVVTCICGARLRIFGQAIDDERRYDQACIAVREWVRWHKHCPLTQQIPGIRLYFLRH
jgi:hypothetical protein